MSQEPRGERGTVTVFVALAMTALLLFAAYAIDVGVVWSSRTQSQNADDSAALAAAANMIDADVPSVTKGAAKTAATNFANQNSTVGVPSVQIDTTEPVGMQFGFWRFKEDPGTCSGASPPCLDTSVSQSDPNLVTGVRVDVDMDNVNNDRSPVFLSQLLGITGFTVKNTAVAYLGFAGSFPAGEFDLPVAIDSCDLSTGGCGSDYCATVTNNRPNPCPLKWLQGNPNVTCLDFSPTTVQNACLTVFDGSSPSVNNPDLRRVIDNGNPGDAEAGDKVYLDNGIKDVTLKYIRDKFYFGVNGDPPAGTDLYGPNPPGSPATTPAIDSWVVKLPVFDCVNHKCSGGGAIAINGGVCFEIREILAPSGPYGDPEKVIKGRFLCPDDPLFEEYCYDANAPPQTGTGCNFGFRADIPMLVE